MTIARNINFGDIISGEELKALGVEYVETSHFECPYVQCKIIATPCSYRPFHKPRSYFKYLEDHTNDCGIHNEKNVKKRIHGKAKETVNAPTSTYISFLRLEPYKRERLPSDSKITSRTISTDSVTNKCTAARTNRDSYARSIRPIVKWFLSHADEGERLLNIPGVNYKSYKNIFRSIYYDDLFIFTGKHIYYGSLWINQNINPIDGHLKLKLVQGKDPENKFYVDIDMKKWKQGEVDLITEDINTAKEQSKKDFIKRDEKQQKKQKSTWIFFLGIPDIDDKMVFRVDDSRLIYVVYCNRPNFPRHGNGKLFINKNTDAKIANVKKEEEKNKCNSRNHDNTPRHSETVSEFKNNKFIEDGCKTKTLNAENFKNKIDTITIKKSDDPHTEDTEEKPTNKFLSFVKKLFLSN